MSVTVMTRYAVAGAVRRKEDGTVEVFIVAASNPGVHEATNAATGLFFDAAVHMARAELGDPNRQTDSGLAKVVWDNARPLDPLNNMEAACKLLKAALGGQFQPFVRVHNLAVDVPWGAPPPIEAA
jgi:acylphosphatase